jgi:hypothetical protein
MRLGISPWGAFAAFQGPATTLPPLAPAAILATRLMLSALAAAVVLVVCLSPGRRTTERRHLGASDPAGDDGFPRFGRRRRSGDFLGRHLHP